MSARVKICGLAETVHVDAAVSAGAALLGFVFFPKSPRHVSIETAAGLTAHVPRQLGKVALSVDADNDLLEAIVKRSGINILQMHGNESVARVFGVKARFGLPVIKALPISTPQDVAAAKRYEGAADMLLFDAKPPPDATRPGGNAEPFDWSLLTGTRWQVPWLLAGGLTPENVAAAVTATGAPMVDVSSGVEEAPGQKSVQKIQSFIRAAHSA